MLASCGETYFNLLVDLAKLPLRKFIGKLVIGRIDILPVETNIRAVTVQLLCLRTSYSEVQLFNLENQLL